MNKKGQKRAEKNVSTSFPVLQAPKSWSKYTTKEYLNIFLTDMILDSQTFLMQENIQ